MAQNDFVMQGTILNPPADIGGVEYSLYFEGTGKPKAWEPSSDTRTTAKIVLVTDLGGGLKQIKCERGNQKSSFTFDPDPEVVGTTIEVEYEWKGGGNVCATAEPERGISHANDRALAGPDAGDRALPGMMIWQDVAGVERGWFIDEAKPYAIAPSNVDFTPTGDAGHVWSAAVAGGIILSPTDDTAELVFDTADTLMGDVGGAYQAGAGSLVLAERKIFDADGPVFYPDDADWGSMGASPRFHFDTDFWRVRLASEDIASGPYDKFWLTYYERFTTEGKTLSIGANFGVPLVLEAPEGGAGYSESFDTLVSALSGELGDGDHIVDVQGGSGGVEWRETPARGSRVVALEWARNVTTGQADLSGGWWRPNTNGTIQPVSVTAASYDYPFQVRVQRAGTDVVISHRQDSGESWVVEPAIVIGTASQPWQLGITTVDRVKWKQPAATPVHDWRLTRLGAETSLAWGITQVVADELESTWVVTSLATAIVSVENLTTGEAMTSSATPARDHYQSTFTGGVWQFTFYAESSGDVIQVAHELPTSDSTPPGRPPRAVGQVNWGTETEVGSGVATSNVNENVANWHDELIVVDSQDTLPTTPGVEFAIRNDAGGDPRDSFTVQWDSRELGEGHDWTTISSGEYVFIPEERKLWIKKSFVDDTLLPALSGGTLCIRIVGPFRTLRNDHPEWLLNKMIGVVESWDQGWTTIQLGAAGDTLSGDTTIIPVGLDYACVTYPAPPGGFQYLGATSAGWGSLKGQWSTETDELIAGGGTFPYHHFETGSHTIVDAKGEADGLIFTSDTLDGIISCAGGGILEKSAEGAESYRLRHRPDRGIGDGSGVNRAGAYEQIVGVAGGNITEGIDILVEAAYQFRGVSLDIRGLLARIPDGAEIVEAKAEVIFENLKSWQWNFTYFDLRIFPDEDPNPLVRHSYIEHHVNGVLAWHEEWQFTGGTSGNHFQVFNSASPVVGGNVGFVLVGKRLDSSPVYLPRPQTWAEFGADDWKVFGQGLSIGGSAAESGTASLVDITPAIQTLINHPDARRGLYRDFQLWPAPGEIVLGANENALTAYLDGLLPVTTAQIRTEVFDPDADTYHLAGTATPGPFWTTVRGIQGTASGSRIEFDDLTIVSVQVRYRVGSVVDRLVLGVVPPPAAIA